MMRYFEPQPFYHNDKHIEACLNEFAPARSLCAHPDEAELALWYHDAIYDSKAKDNEERSADLACKIARGAGLNDEFSQRVRALILATKHNSIPSGIDACVVVDCDLSILGKPAAEFDAYEAAIRKEYAWVSEHDFRSGRRAVLEQFLKRAAIFSTDLFRAKYEQAARANLESSIARL